MKHELLAMNWIVSKEEWFLNEVDTPAVKDGRRCFKQLMRVDNSRFHLAEYTLEIRTGRRTNNSLLRTKNPKQLP